MLFVKQTTFGTLVLVLSESKYFYSESATLHSYNRRYSTDLHDTDVLLKA